MKSQGFQINQLQIGLVGSISNLGMVISTVMAAHFSKYSHPFTMVTIGQTLWTVSAFFGCASQSFWMLLVSKVLMGVSEGIFVTVIAPCILELSPNLSKTTWFSIYMCSIPIGISIGYLFGSNIGSVIGWRSPLFIEGLVMMPLVLALSLLYRDPKMQVSHEPANGQEIIGFIEEVKALARSKIYCYMVGGLASFYFFATGICIWFPYILEYQFGIEAKIAGDIASLNMLLTGIFGTFLGSIYQDRKLASYQRNLEAGELMEEEMNMKRCEMALFMCGVSGTAALAMFLVAALSNNFWIFIACFFLAWLVSNLSIGSFGLGVMTAIDKSLRNHAIAYSLFIGNLLGSIPGPFAMSVFIEVEGLYMGVIIQILSLVPCCLLWCIAYFIVKRGSTHMFAMKQSKASQTLLDN